MEYVIVGIAVGLAAAGAALAVYRAMTGKGGCSGCPSGEALDEDAGPCSRQGGCGCGPFSDLLRREVQQNDESKE
ncbi:MAG TPA: hypothetical protein VNA25_16635 [Phycisphaerae bacterium]|nr:hypothetical protein [Phycisphaerae bacterium]